MIILAVVWALMAYILIRFRERPGQERPKPIHGHMGLEIAWTIAPAIIVVAIVIPTIRGVFQLQRPPDGGALVVEVTGKRYWWNFHYSGAGSDHSQRAPSAGGPASELAAGIGGCDPLLLGASVGGEEGRESGGDGSGGPRGKAELDALHHQ